MRDSGQKNAPHLKKGGECLPDLLRPAVLSWPSLLPPPGLPMADAGRPAADGVGIITIMRLSADGLRLAAAARSVPRLCPAAWPAVLVPAGCVAVFPAAGGGAGAALMVAQQQRGREPQSLSATPCIVRIRTK